MSPIGYRNLETFKRDLQAANGGAEGRTAKIFNPINAGAELMSLLILKDKYVEYGTPMKFTVTTMTLRKYFLPFLNFREKRIHYVIAIHQVTDMANNGAAAFDAAQNKPYCLESIPLAFTMVCKVSTNVSYQA
ncbi:hypothetical protein LTR56_026515 [Elasticomyces elasticus]|nr:hypothetical protein LTR56_026515 [Elasticomyces elasticus]